MAGLQGHAALPSTGLSGGGTSPKTVIRVKAASNQRAKILGYGFFFDGTSNSAQPVQIQIGRISADGTFTAATVMPDEEGLTETFQTSVGLSASAEPTYSTYMKTFAVHPQLGYEYLAPQGQEIIVKGGGMLGFVCNAPAAVDVRGYVAFEE